MDLASRLRVIVLGYIVRGPLGGMTWHHLQFVLGLLRMGHDAYFIEDSDDYPSCYHPDTYEMDEDPSAGLRYAADVFDHVGAGGRWGYHDAHTRTWFGPCADRWAELISSTDIVVNVSGVNPLRPWLEEIPARVLIDTDPVFTQVRNLNDPAAKDEAAKHTAFFSFGENFGAPGCDVPDDGLPWQPTRQPVVLDQWSVGPAPHDGAFRTVMQWDSYPDVEHGDRVYGTKSRSFAEMLELPRRVDARFELVLGRGAQVEADLRRCGWIVHHPPVASKDPWTYRRFIESSKAEFSVAKHGYAATRSGWFSERSANYLAAGRPVVTQDTGFTDWMETGRGIVAFTTVDEAETAVRDVLRHYDAHAREARDVAARYFESARVLSSLLERVYGSRVDLRNGVS